MLEMQHIMDKGELRALSAGQWKKLIPRIVCQAEIEAKQNLRISKVLCDAKGFEKGHNFYALTGLSIIPCAFIVLALVLLSLMLPDPRVRADPDKIMYYGKVCMSVRLLWSCNCWALVVT